MYCLNDDRGLAAFTHTASEDRNAKKLRLHRGKWTVLIKKEWVLKWICMWLFWTDVEDRLQVDRTERKSPWTIKSEKHNVVPVVSNSVPSHSRCYSLVQSWGKDGHRSVSVPVKLLFILSWSWTGQTLPTSLKIPLSHSHWLQVSNHSGAFEKLCFSVWSDSSGCYRIHQQFWGSMFDSLWTLSEFWSSVSKGRGEILSGSTFTCLFP